ncbi:MAG: Aspartate/alanine antiporter [Phycisphaerae bacterium]|nr:Aspartate/alanine antiporter [Phycisphaerae bacterium]
MELLQTLLKQPLFVLFAVIALGTLLGAVKFQGITLGPAGVFFAALVFGHFGHILPHELTELGLVLFVYSVGLHAGPQFFGILRSRGLSFLLVGVTSTAAGAVAAVILAKVLELSASMTGGLYCGATTCTPALAAVLDAVQRAVPDQATMASVGYGVAYPFSLICVVVTIQALPRIMRITAARAAELYQQEQQAQTPVLEECCFRLTNPNFFGRTIDELQGLHISQAVICRLKRAGVIQSARPQIILQADDVLLAVGLPEELAKLEAVLGDVVVENMADPTGAVSSELVVVSRKEIYGKTMREMALWERFGAVATRVRRGGMEFTPHGSLQLEPGDVLRVVGSREAINSTAELIGREERRLDETSIITFAAGIALGVAVGYLPLPFMGEGAHLGAGGGAFLVGLVLGHLGHLGPVRIYVPNAAKHLMRELGLVIFLAGAGSRAGEKFVSVVQQSGVELLLVGAAITIVTVSVALFLLLRVMRWNILSGGGALSACMTNPPGLAAASQLADADAAAVAFASVYPVGLIAKIVLAQAIFLVLQ